LTAAKGLKKIVQADMPATPSSASAASTTVPVLMCQQRGWAMVTYISLKTQWVECWLVTLHCVPLAVDKELLRCAAAKSAVTHASAAVVAAAAAAGIHGQTFNCGSSSHTKYIVLL